MVLSIIGGRSRFPSFREINQALKQAGISVQEITGFVSGGAKGADQSGAKWARAQGISVREILPDYARYKKGAPLVRNKQIAKEAEICLAFPSAKSKGTYHCIKQFETLGKRVVVVPA